MENLISIGKYLLLSNQSLFRGLSEAELTIIANRVQLVEYNRNEIIYKQGQKKDYCNIIINGMVLVYNDFDDEEEIPIDVLQKGDYFGITSILADRPHSASAKAITSCRILRIDAKSFNKILEEIPKLGIHFSKTLSRRIQNEFKGSRKILKSEVFLFYSEDIALSKQFTQELSEYINTTSKKKSTILTIDLKSKKLINSNDSKTYNINYPEEIPEIINDYCCHYHYIIFDVSNLDFSYLATLMEKSDRLYLLKNRKEILDKEFFGKIDTHKPNQYFLDTIYIREYKDIKDEIKYKVEKLGRKVTGLSIGLALGGGAAMGLAQIGILKILEKENITIDMVTGTSIGALLGSIWASGINAKEIEEACLEFNSIFKVIRYVDLIIPRRGLIAGKNVKNFLERFLGKKNFEDLDKTLKVVACDISTRREVVLSTGKVIDGVMASIAIPGVFTPIIKEDGSILVDGGVVNPLPANILTRDGIKRTIAINSMPSPNDTVKSNKGKQSIMDIFVNSLYSLQYRIARYAKQEVDVYMNPILENSTWFEFHRAADFIALGEKTAIRALEDIKKLTKTEL